jgi:hypothetical protein
VRVPADNHIDARYLACEPLVVAVAQVRDENHHIRLLAQLGHKFPRDFEGVQHLHALARPAIVLRVGHHQPEQRDTQLADLRDDIRGHKRLACVAIAQVRTHGLEASHPHQAQHLVQRVAELVVAQRGELIAAGVHARYIRFTTKLQRERRAVHVVARVDDQRRVGLQLLA